MRVAVRARSIHYQVETVHNRVIFMMDFGDLSSLSGGFDSNFSFSSWDETTEYHSIAGRSRNVFPYQHDPLQKEIIETRPRTQIISLCHRRKGVSTRTRRKTKQTNKHKKMWTLYILIEVHSGLKFCVRFIIHRNFSKSMKVFGKDLWSKTSLAFSWVW